MDDEKALNNQQQKPTVIIPMPQQQPNNSYQQQPTNYRRPLCTFLTIFLLLAALTALILWLIYRPHKPQFTVIGAAVYNLNTTTPPFISTSMQFTILTRNPNKRVSIIYEKLSAFVSYRNQQITPTVDLPPLYHERKSTVVVSPVIGGGGVPVAVPLEVADGLVMDEMYGVVALRVVFMGRLRWKVAAAGGVKSGRHGVYVKCDVLVGLKKGFLGGQVDLLGGSSSTKCDVLVGLKKGFLGGQVDLLGGSSSTKCDVHV